jgi:hypothetical protein
MKTLLIAAAAVVISMSAFAQMSLVDNANYSDTFERSLNDNTDNGKLRFNVAGSASARSTADRDMDDRKFGNPDNYSGNVTAEAFHS